MCQPHMSRSKLQETSGGDGGSAHPAHPHPSSDRGDRETCSLEPASQGSLGAGPGGPWAGCGRRRREPVSFLAATAGLQSFIDTLSTPAPCWPGPSKSTRPTSSSFAGRGGRHGQARAGSVRPSPQAGSLTQKGRRRAPSRTLSTFQTPLPLPGACHTSSREPPSTTASARKPGGGGGHESVCSLPLFPPQGWAEAQRDSGTWQATLKIVSQVEFAVGAGGAQRGSEGPGFGSQLPPGPLQGQEVPWGRRARHSEPMPPREPQHRGPPPGGAPCTGGEPGLTRSSSTGVRAWTPTLLGLATPPLQPPHAGILPAGGCGGLEVRGACRGGRR